MRDYTVPQRDRVALITINAQRDFTLRGSPLRACGVNKAISGLQRLVKGFRSRSIPIFHAVRLYRPDGSNVDSFRRQAVEEGLRVLMPGTFGAELVDQVKPDPMVRLEPEQLLAGEFQTIADQEWVLYKPRWGAFHGTALESHLRALKVNTVVVCGLNFSTSGRATVYEAGARDFRIVLVPDAISGGCEDSVSELGRIGVYLMPTDTCLDWIQRGNRPVAA